jgi:type I restriction enzyme M protein
MRIERDTELLIDNQLVNLGWDLSPNSKTRNVYQQRVKTTAQKKLLGGKRPDYVLYESNSSHPLAIIEAKRPGQNISTALLQGIDYAQKLKSPLVFATDGIFTKAFHVSYNRPLVLNGEQVDELIKESLLRKFANEPEISTLDKKVIKSRGELITIFEKVNNLLREEGLQQGLERFTEFSNILFLKVLSELEEIKEEHGKQSGIKHIYRWESFKKKKGDELLSYVNDTVLKWFRNTYNDVNLFRGLKIKHPDNLKEIINLLDKLQLTDINADIKGDAFEYFIRSYSASNPSDLGEIFTPRHVVRTAVKLANPQIGEKVYDPFCGTGGILIVAFKHMLDTMKRTDKNLRMLTTESLFGSELTRTASIAKMNMILAGDGHSNIIRQDTLANPIDDQYDVVITNYPFAQKTRYGDRYTIPDRNADIICPQHCYRAVRPGGRILMIAPDGFLTNKNSSNYEAVRRYLIENASLNKVVSLPRGSFEPYNRAKASILYFTNVKKKPTKGSYYFHTVNNDGYTLDKKRKPIPGINDLDYVLSETHLDLKSEEYLEEHSITKVDLADIRDNEYVLSAAPYIQVPDVASDVERVAEIGELLAPAKTVKVGKKEETPILSVTMADGLVDQADKFNKRIASSSIKNYKLISRNQMVVGFPIDEGVLGFQLMYDYAAVSPAYKVWNIIDAGVLPEYLELVLRSDKLRSIYRKLMQGSVDRRRSIPDDIFMKIKIPVPSMSVQKQIIDKRKKITQYKQEIKDLEVGIMEDVKNLYG